MSYIELCNIHKKYRDKIVLDGFSLSVERGEMLAVTGASGCGKSTLLHIMTGLETMDSGSYLLDGRELNRAGNTTMAQLRNETIGYILQSYGLISSITAYENIILPLQMRKVIGSETYSIVESIAKVLRITDLLGQKARDLSGGEKQKIAIARALVICPEVILADEPTGSLDQKTSAEIMMHLRRINQQSDKTIVIVTHDPDIATRCDRTVLIEDGRVRGEDLQENIQRK